MHGPWGRSRREERGTAPYGGQRSLRTRQLEWALRQLISPPVHSNHPMQRTPAPPSTVEFVVSSLHRLGVSLVEGRQIRKRGCVNKTRAGPRQGNGTSSELRLRSGASNRLWWQCWITPRRGAASHAFVLCLALNFSALLK